MAFKKTFSETELYISGLKIDVHRKNVKNLNLRVYPAERKVRISVPRRLPEKALIRYLEEKLPWIQKQLTKVPKKSPKTALSFTTGEQHFVWGNKLELVITEINEPPGVSIDNDELLRMNVRPKSSKTKKSSVLKEWYREELKREIPKLIEKWEPILGVSVNEFGVKQMKTRWGTCNIRARRIWLNLELAKKRPELLEYVVVHEMVHLLERLHSKRFYALMSHYLPNWKSLKNELNDKSSISGC